MGTQSLPARTTLACSGAAKGSLATNSPESLNSLLRLFNQAKCASTSPLDHALYVSTPAFVPAIIKMYFMSSAPFLFPHFSPGYLRFHRIVGAGGLFSTSRTINFKKISAQRHVDFAPRESTYRWRFENDERCIGSGC